jgi:hypothetical protein
LNYLHWEVNLSLDECVLVTLDHRANVKLMDRANFDRYRRGQSHQYRGGQATASPVRLCAPHPGRWYVTVDTGGRGSVRASVAVTA